jgi:ABC-type microcin C transport system permease subunit YejB
MDKYLFTPINQVILTASTFTKLTTKNLFMDISKHRIVPKSRERGTKCCRKIFYAIK